METEPYGQLIGREAEQNEIRQLLGQITSGEGGTLVVAGPTGIGKSAVLRDAAAHARSGGLADMGTVVVAHVVGAEVEREWPYSGLHLILSALLGSLASDRQAELTSRVNELLGGLTEDASAYDIARLLQTFMAQIDMPVVIVVDDAHLLDERSQEVLGFVARRLASVPVVVLLSADSARQASSFSGLTFLHLEELRPAEAALLVQRAGGPRTARRVATKIVDGVGGNPGALLDVVERIPQAQLTGAMELDRYLPTSPVAEASLRDVIADLDETERYTLVVVAASDDGRLAPVLRAISEYGEALAEWLVREHIDQSDGIFTLRRPGLASVIWHQAPVTERRRAHGALAAGYGDDDPDQRLWHLAQATREEGDDHLAVALQEASVRRLARGELERSLRLANESLRLSVEPVARVDRLIVVGRVALHSGRLHAASQIARERYKLDTTAQQRADLALLEARARNLLDGDVPAGLITRHVEEVADVDPNRAARLNLLGAMGFAQRMEQAEAARFLALAERYVKHFDEVTRSQHRCAAALLASVSGQHRRALELVGDGWASADVYSEAEQRVCEAIVLIRSERFDDARRLLKGIMQDERLIEAVVVLSAAQAVLTMLESRSGRLTAARESMSAWELSGAGDVWRAVTASSKAHMIGVHALLGEYDEAWECRRQAEDSARRHGDWWATTVVQSETGALLLILGRLDEAVSVLEHARRYALEHADPSLLASEPDYIEACVRAGELGRARAALADFEERALKVPSEWAKHALARCRALASEGEASIALFGQAVTVSTDAISPVEQARTMLCYGERLRRLGRRLDAARWLYRTLTLTRECGAVALAARAQEELRQAGHAAPPDAVRLGELTEAERKIAGLVGAGRRNREIAAELFVSVRTVETHLGRIFRKLGIRSRTELAGLIAGSEDTASDDDPDGRT